MEVPLGRDFFKLVLEDFPTKKDSFGLSSEKRILVMKMMGEGNPGEGNSMRHERDRKQSLF